MVSLTDSRSWSRSWLVLAAGASVVLLSACQVPPKALPKPAAQEAKPAPRRPHEEEPGKEAKWDWEIKPDKGEKAKIAQKKKGVEEIHKFTTPKWSPEQAPRVKGRGELIPLQLNFDNADVVEVVQMLLGDLLKVNYLIAPNIKGLVTFRLQGQVYREDLLALTQVLLNASGAALIEEAGLYKVIPAKGAPKDPGLSKIRMGGPDGTTLANGMVIQVVPVKYVDPQGLLKPLSQFVSPSGAVVVPPSSHMLLLADVEASVAKLMSLIRLLDVPFFAGKVVKIYHVEHVDVEWLAKELESLMQKLSGGRKDQMGQVTFVPIPEAKRLLVVGGSAAMFEPIDVFIDNFDAQVEEQQSRLYVYRCQYQKAESILPVLKDLYKEKLTVIGGKKGRAPTQQAAEMTLISVKDTNTIVIRARPATYAEIKGIIERLDAVPKQVMLKMLIAEVLLKDELQFGVEWYLRGKVGPKSQRMAVETLSKFNPVSGSADKFGAFAVGDNFYAMINMLAAKSDVQILSSPHIMVRDGEEAQIKVGQRVPVVTESVASAEVQVQGTSAFRNQIQYEDTGVIIKVKPRVAESRLVTLDLDQQVSESLRNVTSGIDSPIFTTRDAKTSVVVRSGQTVCIGGMIRTKSSRIEKALPVISKVPWLGRLFRSTDNSDQRTELIMMLTPVIVKTKEDADYAAAGLMKELAALRTEIAKHDTPKIGGR